VILYAELNLHRFSGVYSQTRRHGRRPRDECLPHLTCRQALSPNGWAKIYGPNSMFADYYEITEMPEALNIVVLF
jgi:hypothetical protein